MPTDQRKPSFETTGGGRVWTEAQSVPRSLATRRDVDSKIIGNQSKKWVRMTSAGGSGGGLD